MENNKGVQNDNGGEIGDTQVDPYLGSWKTREAAEEGVKNLQKILDVQGNEVGTLRKQVDFFQKTIEEIKGQSQSKQQPKEVQEQPDYSKEMQDIQKRMESLDPVDEGYHKEMMSLVAKSNAITAKKQHEETLSAAAKLFKKEMDERDTKAMHKAFYDSNPEFSTPEMQMRIQEYLANDRTGMSDPMVAFREIQRDDALRERTELAEKNAELERRLNLKKGEELTGKVVTKGQGIQQKTKQTKATGAERRERMQEALNNLRV
jgi:TolA-binding protein